MNLSELKPSRCGIYKFYNIKTNMIYIGQSTDMENRWKGHIRDFISGKHPNKMMLSDFQLFGLDSFDVEVLEECEQEKLLEREGYWASQENQSRLYNNTKSLKGYNPK